MIQYFDLKQSDISTMALWNSSTRTLDLRKWTSWEAEPTPGARSTWPIRRYAWVTYICPKIVNIKPSSKFIPCRKDRKIKYHLTTKCYWTIVSFELVYFGDGCWRVVDDITPSGPSQRCVVCGWACVHCWYCFVKSTHMKLIV